MPSCIGFEVATAHSLSVGDQRADNGPTVVSTLCEREDRTDRVATLTTATLESPSAQPDVAAAFRVERHGIDLIPEQERWARPRDLAGLWAGASLQVEYVVYGAILMTFGFTFAQAVSLIVIGNLSFLLLGVCSLQGPDSGTTTFGTNRAPFGPNGSRLMATFNWLTQIGFEVEGLILIVGAAIVLALKAGYGVGTPAKVVFIVAAVGVQFVLPFFGHATLVKFLRLLVIPFLAIFVVFLVISGNHAQIDAVRTGAGWQTYMAGLAFTIALSGLGWTENGNDYSRYCPRNASKVGIVGWVFLGTAVPEILTMTLGALIGTFVTGVGATQLSAFAPFVHQSAIPPWFVVTFMIFAIVQLFAVNSLDLYSSGVTLQAIGLRVKRYQAVCIDTVICLIVTFWAVFNSSFTHFLSDFVDLVIVWIAPWVAIYLVDWAMRRFRYVPLELQKTGPGGLYYRSGGIHWPAIVAQGIGMVAAMSALAPSFSVPSWTNPVTVHTGGADFSIFMGMAVGGLVYLVLGARSVRRQADAQVPLLAP
jgi:purine-cytosine permease-like protein